VVKGLGASGIGVEGLFEEFNRALRVFDRTAVKFETEDQGVIREFEVSGEGEATQCGSWDWDVDCDGDVGGVTGCG
jgi:hypothetical protein